MEAVIEGTKGVTHSDYSIRRVETDCPDHKTTGLKASLEEWREQTKLDKLFKGKYLIIKELPKFKPLTTCHYLIALQFGGHYLCFDFSDTLNYCFCVVEITLRIEGPSGKENCVLQFKEGTVFFDKIVRKSIFQILKAISFQNVKLFRTLFHS